MEFKPPNVLEKYFNLRIRINKILEIIINKRIYIYTADLELIKVFENIVKSFPNL